MTEPLGSVQIVPHCGTLTFMRKSKEQRLADTQAAIAQLEAAGLKAHTGSGSIHASAIAGPASASTGSGGITMAQTGPGEVSASSGSEK